MKTTVDLPDDLLIAVKKRAAEERTTLREMFEKGLRGQLARKRSRPRSEKPKIRWVTVRGGLPPGVDPSDRAAMHDWIRRNR